MASIQTTLKNYFSKERKGKTSKPEDEVGSVLKQLLTSV